jgi:hypothetical protein
MVDQQGNQKAAPQDIAQVVIHYFNTLLTSQLTNAPVRNSPSNTPT